MGFQITTRDNWMCSEGEREAASQQAAGGLASVQVTKKNVVCFVLRLYLKMLADALGQFCVLPAGNEEHIHKSSSE